MGKQEESRWNLKCWHLWSIIVKLADSDSSSRILYRWEKGSKGYSQIMKFGLNDVNWHMNGKQMKMMDDWMWWTDEYEHILNNKVYTSSRTLEKEVDAGQPIHILTLPHDTGIVR